MVKRIVPITVLALIIAMAGCSKNKESERSRQTRDLYERSCKLARLYTDSISAAGDSLKVERLLNNYEHRLTQLNYDFDADTDIYMTESQNDTLITLTDLLLAAADSTYHRLSSRPLPPDSIPEENLPTVN